MSTVDSIQNEVAQRDDAMPFLHDLPAFRRDPLQFWLDTGTMGPIVAVQVGPASAQRYLVVTDADLFQHVLQTKARIYPRGEQIGNRNKIDSAPTVFNAPTYDEWLWRRRLLQPAFHGRELAKFGAAMVAETQQVIAEIGTAAPVNWVDVMKRLTMRIICRTMFSATLDETEQLQHAFEQTSAFSYRQLTSVVKIPEWLPVPAVTRTRAAVETMGSIIGRIVQARLDSGTPQNDMLDMLISAHLDEDGRQFSDRDLKSEMRSIIFAGHETTAMTLVWLFYTLTQRPDIEQRLRTEIDATLGTRAVTLADIDAMPYTHQLIQETLRYFPSVYLTMREAETADRLADVAIDPGTRLILNIRGLHRDPRYWDDPNTFDPDRFADTNHARHKFAYMPFIAGPKKCIGDTFALMEMRLVIPTILQMIQMSYAGDQPAREQAGFVMEADGPVMMRTMSRKDAQ